MASLSTPTASDAVAQYKVEVWLYDLSQGMARQLSLPFLGKQIDGIWHTGVVVYGYEWFYGGGIQCTRPGHTMAGQPLRKIDMGYTSLSQSTFHQFLRGVSPRFTPHTYSLLSHNCNNFSHEAVKFLTGADMPAYITGLPEEALASPLGAMLRPMIANMEQQMKQQVGGMGGAVPWSAELLSLPPLDARPDRYHSQSEVEAEKAAQAQRLSEQKQPIAGASTTILSPTTSDHPSHPHASLGLSSVSASSKPLLSADKKTSSFFVLLKANSKKLSPPLSLSDEERATMETVVDLLGRDGELTAEVEKKAEALFDRLVRDWPAEQMFPVLGLLRVFVLRPSVAVFYEDKWEQFLASMLRFLPTEGSTGTTAPMAAQAMALCVVANLFNRPSFASRLSTSAPLLSTCRFLLSSPHQTVRVMAATVLYSLSLCLPKEESDDEIELTSLLAERVGSEEDAEVAWRELLALGHLMYGNSGMALLLSSLEWTGDDVRKRFTGNAKIEALVKDIHAMTQHEQKVMTEG